MFNSLPALTSSLSFGKIIGGISKTLNIANQLIPLYIKAKPIISNANKTLGILKEITSNSASQKNSKNPSNNNIEAYHNNSEISTNKKEENEPTFFL